MKQGELVTFRNGPTVPEDAFWLATRVEGLGYTMRVEAGKLLLTQTPGCTPLTSDDKAQIAKWKPHLLALVDYRAEAEVESAAGK